MGHSLVCPLIHSHRWLISWLHTACFTCAFCCALLFAWLLTTELAGLDISKRLSFVPQCFTPKASRSDLFHWESKNWMRHKSSSRSSFPFRGPPAVRRICWQIKKRYRIFIPNQTSTEYGRLNDTDLDRVYGRERTLKTDKRTDKESWGGKVKVTAR